jgi:hypothetical protein
VALKQSRILELRAFVLNQLASVNPGDYFVFDLDTKRIVVSLVSTNGEAPAIRE